MNLRTLSLSISLRHIKATWPRNVLPTYNSNTDPAVMWAGSSAAATGGGVFSTTTISLDIVSDIASAIASDIVLNGGGSDRCAVSYYCKKGVWILNNSEQ
jgi:hypothetical protein